MRNMIYKLATNTVRMHLKRGFKVNYRNADKYQELGTKPLIERNRTGCINSLINEDGIYTPIM